MNLFKFLFLIVICAFSLFQLQTLAYDLSPQDTAVLERLYVPLDSLYEDDKAGFDRILLLITQIKGQQVGDSRKYRLASEIESYMLQKNEDLSVGDEVMLTDVKILIETSLGSMEAILYDSTPLHRDNFVLLVKEGYYDDLLFHRVIEGFMIQGGDPDSRDAPADKRLGTGGPGYQIPAEIGQPHIKGRLAAARDDNPEKKSSGSQFYISQGEVQSEVSLTRFASQKGISYTPEQKAKYSDIGGVPMLDGEYTVFGEITIGLDVLDKIAGVETAPGDRPLEDVKMMVSVVE